MPISHRSNRFAAAVLLFLLACASGCGLLRHGGQVLEQKVLLPPVAKKIPKADTLHGDVRVDDYFWLRDQSDPDVMKYLEAENEYARAVMRPTESLQEELYRELLGRMRETDTTAAEKRGGYLYYTRNEKGLEYAIHCRKKGTPGAEEEVLLDENVVAAGHEFLSLGVFEVSPDQSLLAYSLDTTGSESYTLYFKRLDTSVLLEDEIPNTGYSAAWANDNRTIFYTVLDSTSRPYQLYRHRLSTPPSEDRLAYQENDAAFFLGASRTRDGKCILLELTSHTTSEVHYLYADSVQGEFAVIQPRVPGMEYYVEHRDGTFFIRTNDNAKNYRLVKATAESPSRADWKDVVAHRDSTKVEDFVLFRSHLAVFERDRGLQQIWILDLEGEGDQSVEFTDPAYTIWPARNPEFDTELLRYNYSSLVSPRKVFDYAMDSGAREVVKEYAVPGGFDSSLYESERAFAPAPDGALVPISLVHRRGMKRDGSNPLLLEGYGAYGISSDPYFSSSRLSLLDRGFVYAIAHVRGGGEMGRYWYDEGRLLNKKNTFSDFVACAEFLIDQGYTSKEKLVIYGASAGGLLVGAVVNMRPDLFKAVVADVPFVDLLNTMLDPSLPLTVIEYEEWGNPEVEEFYSYMKSYSPYDNLGAGRYPNMLITGGLHDIRVSYWEPAKWTAKLRALGKGDNLLLLKTRMSAGHAGVSGRYDFLHDVAFEYAFLLSLSGAAGD